MWGKGRKGRQGIAEPVIEAATSLVRHGKVPNFSQTLSP